jgi:prevent-host-death family protein
MNYNLIVRINVHEAKTRLSRLLELVEQGESVTIARRGKPVADLVKARRTGFPVGIAVGDPLVPTGDDWWKPMSDNEVEGWMHGR